MPRFSSLPFSCHTERANRSSESTHGIKPARIETIIIQKCVSSSVKAQNRKKKFSFREAHQARGAVRHANTRDACLCWLGFGHACAYRILFPFCGIDQVVQTAADSRPRSRITLGPRRARAVRCSSSRWLFLLPMLEVTPIVLAGEMPAGRRQSKGNPNKAELAMCVTSLEGPDVRSYMQGRVRVIETRRRILASAVSCIIRLSPS
jgi:hypothetical protein